MSCPVNYFAILVDVQVTNDIMDDIALEGAAEAQKKGQR
jgi:hypothetical protein